MVPHCYWSIAGILVSFPTALTNNDNKLILCHLSLIYTVSLKNRTTTINIRDVTEPAEICFKIDRMQICWCTIKVQPNTLVNFIKFC